MESKKRGGGRLQNEDDANNSKRPRREENNRHKRKGGSNRLMLQKSFAYITSMYSCTEFAQVATTDREDTISIFSRRVNTKRLTESSTTYSVLRSWVQDDPDRPPNPEVTPNVSVSKEVAAAENDPVVMHLLDVLKQSAHKKERSDVDIMDSVNSLSNVPTSELLLTHVAYCKKIRDIWRMIAAVRYTHIRSKLIALGAPNSTAMDRILEKEKDDVSLKKITALLSARRAANSEDVSVMEVDK